MFSTACKLSLPGSHVKSLTNIFLHKMIQYLKKQYQFPTPQLLPSTSQLSPSIKQPGTTKCKNTAKNSVTLLSLIEGGSLYRFCQKIPSISIYYHPHFRQKFLKIAIFSPFVEFFDNPFYYYPQLMIFSEKFHHHCNQTPYNEGDESIYNAPKNTLKNYSFAKIVGIRLLHIHVSSCR